MDRFFDELSALPNVWELLQAAEKPIALYGMGNGADKVLAAFECFGITPAGVMASDGFVRGQRFHGFTVKKLSDLECELGDFIVALSFGSQLPEVIASIKNVAVRHALVVPCVPPFGEALFDRDIISAHRDRIK